MRGPFSRFILGCSKNWSWVPVCLRGRPRKSNESKCREEHEKFDKELPGGTSRLYLLNDADVYFTLLMSFTNPFSQSESVPKVTSPACWRVSFSVSVAATIPSNTIIEMAVQEEFTYIMQSNVPAFDEAQAIKNIIDDTIAHPVDSFVSEMSSKDWDLTNSENLEDTALVLPPPMTNDTASTTSVQRPTHKRKVTIDETSPAFTRSSDELTLTADDWRIGAEQLLDIEPTPVEELMKQEPIPLVVSPPSSPPTSKAVATVNPPPLTLPEDMPVAAQPQLPPMTTMQSTIANLPPTTTTAPITLPTAPITAPLPPLVASSLNMLAAPSIAPKPVVVTVPKTTKTKRTRRRRKEPQIVQYIAGEPTDIDCVLGRGGKSNHHPGNKRYRTEVQKLQKWYKASDKSEKTDLSQCLVNIVHQYGGRFVKQEKSTGRWYVVSNLVARRKASQALREHLTLEERAARKAAMARNLPVAKQ